MGLMRPIRLMGGGYLWRNSYSPLVLLVLLVPFLTPRNNKPSAEFFSAEGAVKSFPLVKTLPLRQLIKTPISVQRRDKMIELRWLPFYYSLWKSNTFLLGKSFCPHIVVVTHL